jgi:hypothetical protein
MLAKFLPFIVITVMGCATVVTRGGRDQKVTVTSNLPEAQVVVDGKPVGAAPTTLELSRKSDHTIAVTGPHGGAAMNIEVKRKLNPWLLGNILIGGIPGLIIDVVTDSTHRLDKERVHAEFPLKTEPPRFQSAP